MSPSIRCPVEHELLEVLSGEPVSEQRRAHLHDCPDCRGRLDQLRSELSAIRAIDPGPASSGPVTIDREPSSAPCDGSPPSTEGQSPLGSDADTAVRDRALAGWGTATRRPRAEPTEHRR